MQTMKKDGHYGVVQRTNQPITKQNESNVHASFPQMSINTNHQQLPQTPILPNFGHKTPGSSHITSTYEEPSNELSIY